MSRTRCALIAVAGLFVAAPTQAFELVPPIECELPGTCFIQYYVDIDPGPGWQDFACGAATYNGHKGTDFRLISTAAIKDNVKVLAAAAGVVKWLRDGMADRLITKKYFAALRGRDCGNNVVIDHGGGWTTQYCHMKRGSVVVTKGQQVDAGTPLGAVGYSGRANFAHLHLSVRHNGKVIDPFTGKSAAVPTTCSTKLATPEGSLWSRTKSMTRQQMPKGWQPATTLARHLPRSRIIETRLMGEIVKDFHSEAGLAALPAFDKMSPVALFIARLINLRAGDELRLWFVGPGGIRLGTATKILPAPKATYSAYVGRKRRGASWPSGRYTGQIKVIRGGKLVAFINHPIDIK